eukprot:CAMPEP_0119034888 /NCGR_PEP_ID=MMETSP1177-20130426/1907_1 /TAXON_ID=2985 /ORGANISM="Ochromonas sp, Strain CCMP1899" /LENGTH=349 /DNA_ID=CAMNT_0006992691 /DNA_START=266 /DNA_END=1312 /DNA_ORIENTATION=+
MLADGLSGLRQDLGAFSRVTSEDMDWDKRGKLLLHEILQYDPDVITLQECDHYYDCFLPELNARGYDGMFAPKPASACLEVSDSSDGCAIFVRRNKMFITSAETITYTLAQADVKLGKEEDKKPEKPRKSRPGREDVDDADSLTIRAQNQVALILICEFINTEVKSSDVFDAEGIVRSKQLPPPIIIATTHLKASKTLQGERYRVLEMNQLLSTVEKAAESLIKNNRNPAIIITGDLNASPTKVGHGDRGYEPLAYAAVKSHKLNLRSLLNDDLIMISENSRKKQEEETDRKSRKDKLVDFTSLDKQKSSLTELDIRDIRELSRVDVEKIEATPKVMNKVMDDEIEEVW